MTKRKRKGGLDTNNPGKHFQVLMLYSDPPTDVQGLKNGHILYQEKVHTAKVDALNFFKNAFSIDITTNTLQSLLRSVNKYKNLARKADDKRFREICETAFTNYSVSLVPDVPSTSGQVSVSRRLNLDSSSDEEGTSDTQTPRTPLLSFQESPVLESASVRSLKRKGLLTSLKKKMLQRENDMKKDVRTLKHTVSVLKAKLSSKRYKQNRYLQRQVGRLYERLKRKDEKLKQKDKELGEIKKGGLEASIQKDLASAKRTIRRLKQQHRGCASKVKLQKVMSENQELKRKLKEKESAELVIQDRVLQLEDELNLLINDESVECREDGRTVKLRFI